MTIVAKFVNKIPSEMEEGTIYISTSVNTAVHLCPCGCKTEIITPIDPSGWNFTYDGEAISLYPSVGIWGTECKSHYWIKKNHVDWSRTYTKEKIEEIRNHESLENQDNYNQLKNEDIQKTRYSWFRTKMGGNID